MPRTEDTSRPAVYTMGQLNQKTAFVMNQIEKDGPALITRHGHFVAVIRPIKEEIVRDLIAQRAVAATKQESSQSVQTSGEKPVIFTTRQLGQQTVQVMDEIEKNGPTLITRYGHLVAVISPIKGEIESRVLAEYARGLGGLGAGPPVQAPA